jgi:hypothetical protein
MRNNIMDNLILPETVIVNIVDPSSNQIDLKNIIIKIILFARYKNNYHLIPFITDSEGISSILKADLIYEIQSSYDSGLMDYAPIDSCSPNVEIRIASTDEIDRAINARTNIYTRLLSGEQNRWDSINDLIKIYKESNNKLLQFHNDKHIIHDQWNGMKTIYTYSLIAGYK